MIKVTKQAFFNPFVGSNYHKGISGKRILVLGASFYCPKTECSFFRSCTNTTIKDSSQLTDAVDYFYAVFLQ